MPVENKKSGRHAAAVGKILHSFLSSIVARRLIKIKKILQYTRLVGDSRANQAVVHELLPHWKQLEALIVCLTRGIE
jgi:hypothetical protein